ncbi:hypothetical protein FHU38_004398 [Saccharomonospora amisosensis]|uniref:Uncharacterized protein n=1 Tax=Saccharomonospora amisosensis TaxID=1128677 RepID=A0A7X5UUQ5_9PSEU|nr:hypothetical protein [Saccharomonospora amisosensis]NIJ14054.1 hypothetical protein [Saccharomonospora amisosensis]
MRVLAVVVGLLALAASFVVIGSVTPVTSSAEPLVAAAPYPAQDVDPEPGPTLDPQTEVDADKDRSRLVVGAAAAVLLGIVLWGRHIRKKRQQGG